MSVVSAPSSSSYRNNHHRYSRRNGGYGGPPPAQSAFNRLRYDQDRAGLLPHSKSFDKSSMSRDDRSYWDGNDASTVVSGCTSVCSYSAMVQQKLEREKLELQRAIVKDDNTRHCCCVPSCNFNFPAFISFLSILGVPAIVATPFITPYFGYEWPGIICDLNSQRFLLFIGVCLVIQIIAAWKVHSKRPSARLPRIVLSRVAFTLSLIFVLTGFGLSFVANDVLPRNPNYVDILLHALLLLITTFLIHSLWYFFEIRQPQVYVTVHVTRDPDGESHAISIRESAVQEAVVEILSKYSSVFTPFNPYKFRAKKEGQGNFKFGGNGLSSIATTGFKVYTIDEIEGPGNDEPNGVISVANAKTLIQAAVRRGRKDRAETFHQNLEYERKVDKRRSELLLATEEAFNHINGINTNNAKFKAKPMDPNETATIILSAVYRPLMKYLKLTHQNTNFSLQSFGENLRICLEHGFTAETFLQPYFSRQIPLNEDVLKSSKWSLLSDTHPANTLSHGQHFILRCLDQDQNLNLRLICRIESCPTFNIVQERSRNASYAYHFTPPGDSQC